jgi:hypothetical protein
MRQFAFSKTLRGAGVEQVASAVQEIQEHLRSRTVEGLDAYISRRDLVAWGFATSSESAGAGVAQPPIGPVPISPTTETPSSGVPLAASGLQANGGLAAVFLKWTAPNDSNRGYWEVFRASVDNRSLAVLIGQTVAQVYADNVQTGSTGYYWVRAVNKWFTAIVSPDNAVNGVAASTAPDMAYLLDVMTGSGADQPFYYQAAPTVIGGVPVPAGVYMKSLYAQAATVDLFRAGLAVIDNANIISLNAVKITAGEMSADRINTPTLVAKQGTFSTGDFQTIFAGKAFIANANIPNLEIGFGKISDTLQSTNYVAGVSGWRLAKAGVLEAVGANFSGTITASSITGGSIYGTTVTSGTIIAGVIRSNVAMGTYVTPAGSRVASVSGWTYWLDTNATGTQLQEHVNGVWRRYADGRQEIDNLSFSRSNVVASGNFSEAPVVRYTVSTPPDWNPGSG